MFVPLSIFYDRSVSILEALSEYMKDSLGLGFSQIAKAINRNQRTVWTCYSRAKKKRKTNHVPETSIQIPVYIFQDRTVSVLEVLSEYMKDSLGLNYHQIGVLLNRDERTIWTCYNRAKAKRRK